MSRPDDTPFTVTPNALAAIVQHCVAESSDGEACGLIFGSGGVARWVQPITNTAPDRTSNYAMRDEDVIAGHQVAEKKGDALLGVFHSHPTSAAIPSEADRKNIPDAGPGAPAHLIVSLANAGNPAVRAWRFDLEYIGSPRATEVLLHVTEDGEPFGAKPPALPWALTVGNRVRMKYQRPGQSRDRIITTEIVGMSPNDDVGAIALNLSPTGGTDPRHILVGRIKAVQVLREAPSAGRVRQRAATYARAITSALEDDRPAQVPAYAIYIAAAYPAWLDLRKDLNEEGS